MGRGRLEKVHLTVAQRENLEQISRICDNLNTHNIASLYEAFPAVEAHRLARRLEIYHTPRNGSWLNVAEIELSVLSQQCLDRRIPTVEELNQELEAWQKNLIILHQS